MTKKQYAHVEERFQKAYDMRTAGSSWQEIADTLGVKKETAMNYVARMETRLGTKVKEFRDNTPEIANPAKTAELVDKAMAERGLDAEKFRALAKAAGMPEKMANGLMTRIRANYSNVMKEVRLLKGQELLDTLHAKISKALEYLDDYALANASAKDLAVIVAVLIDKVQILGGLPTQVIYINVSHKLEVMMPAFMQEAARRGITLDATPSAVVIEQETK